MLGAIVAQPGAAIARCTNIALVPTIRRPLPGIAKHAKETKWVWREAVDVSKNAIVSFAPAAIAVRIVGSDGIAPPARLVGAATCRVFPLRFSRQPIRSLPVSERRI